MAFGYRFQDIQGLGSWARGLGLGFYGLGCGISDVGLGFGGQN